MTDAKRCWRRLSGAATLAVLVVAAACRLAGAAPSPVVETTATRAEIMRTYVASHPHIEFRVRYPGVYRVYGSEMAAAGADLSQMVPGRIALHNRGDAVPVEVVSASSMSMVPDSYVEFVGDLPHGTYSTRSPLNLDNVYVLTWLADEPVRYTRPIAPSTPRAAKPTTFIEDRFLEKDLLLRYSRVAEGVTDSYFWVNQNAGSDLMYPLRLSFPGFDAGARQPASITLRLFGLTEVATVKPNHKFNVFLGDAPIGTAEFDGIRYFDFQTTVAPILTTRTQLLKLLAPPDRRSVVDGIALDSIRLRYPRHLDADGREVFVFNNDLVGADLPTTAVVRGLPRGARVYSPAEAKVYLPATRSATEMPIAMRAEPTTYTLIGERGWNRVDSIETRPPCASIADVPADTEAVIVYHPLVRRAAQFLARYRTATGLKTHAVDVTSVFDALNDGFISDKVLKRYLRYVREQAPGLSYIVLMGDSTNDYREIHYDDREFGSNDDLEPRRILIPIHWVFNPETTHAFGYPDDNWFGSFTWPNTPDVAVGRIPADTEDQAFSHIRKIIEYEQGRETTNSQLLLISSVEKSFQDLVLREKQSIGDHFSTVTELFPETTEADREVARLRDEIDTGTQLIYYVGHGGAFVWRVGPTDYKQQKDLFTPADVARLRNAPRYPLIVCSSCYVTSFDNRYSLGEAFILQPHAGGIAIVGTPWKTGVYENHAFNEKLLDAYTDASAVRLGDIFMMAKRATRPAGPDVIDFQTFTILGDPCLKLVRKPQ